MLSNIYLGSHSMSRLARKFSKWKLIIDKIQLDEFLKKKNSKAHSSIYIQQAFLGKISKIFQVHISPMSHQAKKHWYRAILFIAKSREGIIVSSILKSFNYIYKDSKHEINLNYEFTSVWLASCALHESFTFMWRRI